MLIDSPCYACHTSCHYADAATRDDAMMPPRYADAADYATPLCLLRRYDAAYAADICFDY